MSLRKDLVYISETPSFVALFTEKDQWVLVASGHHIHLLEHGIVANKGRVLS